MFRPRPSALFSNSVPGAATAPQRPMTGGAIPGQYRPPAPGSSIAADLAAISEMDGKRPGAATVDVRPVQSIKLSKFNISRMADNCTVVCIGKRGTGKSQIIRDILWHKRQFPVATIISPTEPANRFYSNIVPSLFIHDNYNAAIITNILLRQIKLSNVFRKDIAIRGTSAIDQRMIFIMDDCLYDDKVFNDKELRSIFMNGRHYNILYILAMQYVMGIKPALRGQIDYIFILRENQVSLREKIYKQFAGMFPTFDMFCQIMDQCTENYECLVIANCSRSNKIEDQVFWYKAEQHGNFQIGSREMWAKSAEHDRKKEEAEDAGEIYGSEFDPSNPGGRKKGPYLQVKKY